MYQLIRETIVMRFRMALLLMAMVIMPFCLVGCHSEKNGETKTESGERESNGLDGRCNSLAKSRADPHGD